ncbi:MAG: hypothetical protein K9H26_10875 [Prolixibacteraceae bacterium]|nr:hypothetical protein [Prolixibacteraceae bacterium]
MKNTFTPQEIEFLQSKRLISHIAKQIASPRSQRPGAHVSSKYVSDVLSGKVVAVTETTKQIKKYAGIYLQIANNSENYQKHTNE